MTCVRMYALLFVSRRKTYTLEVLREGSVVDGRELAGKDHYTFGRTPDNGADASAACCALRLRPQTSRMPQMFSMCADVVLEHPSSSRLHAVIQFKTGTGEAFLYDAASAHGVFLNKRRLKPRQYQPLRWGALRRPDDLRRHTADVRILMIFILGS